MVESFIQSLSPLNIINIMPNKPIKEREREIYGIDGRIYNANVISRAQPFT
jgi:hypothetical protein